MEDGQRDDGDQNRQEDPRAVVLEIDGVADAEAFLNEEGRSRQNRCRAA
jgi:hypothetical protein